MELQGKPEVQEKVQEKVNPFRELPKPKQPQAKESKPEQSRQKGEIVIKLNGWKIAKGFMMLVVLLAVFFAGRFTAGDTSLGLPDFSKYFSSDAGPSGLVTGDAAENKSETENAELAPEVQEDSSTEVASNASAEEAEQLQPEVDDTPEKFTTEKYSQVTLSIDGVYKEWKGTWGKIKGFKYTIDNKELGTIKPHHFTMVVEGYEDGEKQFDVGIVSQRVKSGQAVSDEAAVSGGFAYSPVSIPDGDLKKVRISLVLKDEFGQSITGVTQEMDLSE
jgi:hypothetical protein